MRKVGSLFVLTGWLFGTAASSAFVGSVAAQVTEPPVPAITAQDDTQDRSPDDKKKEPRYIDKKPKDENRRDDDKQDDTKKKERRPQNDLCP